MNQPSAASQPPGAPKTWNWEAMFREGMWDYLADTGETPRYGLVAGYIHRLVGTGRILDVGCGDGVLLDYLDLGRISYSGFDVSPTAVERARGRARGHTVDVIVASMDEFTPRDAEQFDAVLFNECLQYSRHPIDTLDNFSRMVKPGGHVLLSQFQSFAAASDGARFAPVFEAELSAGRLRPAHLAETLNLKNGLRWRLYSFAASATAALD